MVKVWNDNIHDLDETFKGDKILIPAGKYIEMDPYEANDFKGQYKQRVLDASGLQDPKSFKMVRIEKSNHLAPVAPMLHKCQVCGIGYESEKVLGAHADEAHADVARLEIPYVDEELKAKKAIKKAV